MDAKTAKAFDELRIAAARHMGWDPDNTEITICRPQPHEIEDDDEISDRPVQKEEFFYAGNY